MPSSSGVFRSFLVASFRRSKYPSVAALWYRVMSKKKRFVHVLHFVSLPLHPSSHAGLAGTQSKHSDGWKLGVDVSAAQSNKAKAKSALLLEAAQFKPHYSPS